MLRSILISILALGAAGAAVAGQHDRNDDRRGSYERRYDNDRHDRRDDRRDSRRDERRWDRRDDRPAVRYYAPPRVEYRRGYRPAPPQYFRAVPRPHGWYQGWREPYARGYRYWSNDRYYYVERGMPAVELSFVLPLR